MRILLIWLLILPSALILQAQDYHFINYSVNDGLPSNELYKSIQDSEGYIWISSDRGVTRYNGYEFQVFTTEDGLPDNVVFDIHEDDQKRIWFEGFDDFSYYDMELDKIIPVKGKKALKIKKKAENIQLFYSIQNDTLTSYTFTTYYQYHISGDSISLINSFSSQESSSMDDIERIGKGNKKNDIILQLPSDADINSIAYDQYKIKKHHKFIKFKEYIIPITHKSRKDRAFYMPFSDTTGILSFYGFNWFINKWRFSPTNEDLFFSIYKDSKNIIWLGGRKKCFRFSGKIDDSLEVINFFNGKIVTSINEDNQGGLWFTTIESGIYYVKNRETKVLTKDNGLINSPVKQLLRINNKLDTSIIAAYLDRKYLSFINKNSVVNREMVNNGIENKLFHLGNDWFITTHKLDCIRLFKGVNSQKLHVKDEKEYSASYFDEVNKILWRNKNIKWLKWDQQNIKFIPQTEKRRTQNTPNETMSLFRDTLWSGGVYGFGFSVNGSEWQEVTSEYNPEKRVTDLDQYNNQYLVIGTLGRGIGIKKGSRIFWIKQKHGLLSNLINNIYVSPSTGDIWAGSNFGLNKIHINWEADTVSTLDISNYTLKDGLPSLLVNDVIEKNKNEVWVATESGIAILNPNSKTRFCTPIHIISFGTDKQNFSKEVLPEFDYQESVEFNFIGLDYKNTDNIKYSYRLLGREEDWQKTNSRTVRYSKLTEGEYTFQVKIEGEEHCQKIASASFTIATPFWKAWWFIILMITALLYVVYFRIKLLQRTARLKTKLIESKQQALSSQMNPHFLFNAFNSLRSLIIVRDFSNAETFVIKIAELFRSVFNNSALQSISLEKELEMLRQYLKVEELRSENSFDYDIILENEDEISSFLIPPLSLQPFVENSIFHGFGTLKNRRGKIVIHCFKENDTLVIVIKDNGVGYNPSTVHKTNKPHGIDVTKERFALLKEVNKQYVDVKIETNTAEESSGTKVTITFSNSNIFNK